jgi:hypothetical protein
MNNQEKIIIKSGEIKDTDIDSRKVPEVQQSADIISLHDRMSERFEESASEIWDRTRGAEFQRVVDQGLPFDQFEKVFSEMANEIPVANIDVVKRESFGKATVLSVMREFVKTGGSEFFDSLPKKLRDIAVHYRLAEIKK